jgi:hypothetical protein
MFARARFGTQRSRVRSLPPDRPRDCLVRAVAHVFRRPSSAARCGNAGRAREVATAIGHGTITGWTPRCQQATDSGTLGAMIGPMPGRRFGVRFRAIRARLGAARAARSVPRVSARCVGGQGALPGDGHRAARWPSPVPTGGPLVTKRVALVGRGAVPKRTTANAASATRRPATRQPSAVQAPAPPRRSRLDRRRSGRAGLRPLARYRTRSSNRSRWRYRRRAWGCG